MKTVASLWGGVGGGMLGFVQAGYNPVWISDDRDFTSPEHVIRSWTRYREGQTMSTPEWRDLNLLFKEQLKQSLNVLVGSPPCKRFSALAMKKKDRLQFDPQQLEYTRFLKAVNFIQPECFVLENLGGISRTLRWSFEDTPKAWSMRDILTLTLAVDDSPIIELPGYVARSFLLNSKYFNVPQSRNRLYVVGLKKSMLTRGNLPPEIGHTPGIPRILTVRDAFKDIEGLPNMEKAHHSAERIAGFAKLKPGESYYGTQNNRLIPLDKPGPVITSHRTQHVCPHEPRTLTVRECARIMGFPDEFVLYGPRTRQFDQVGCGVCPPVALHIATKLLPVLETS